MTPSEHPQKLADRNKVAKKNAEASKMIVVKTRAWAKEAKAKALQAEALATAMEALQGEITAYEAAYADVVGTLVKQEKDYAKETDAKKQDKIDKEHAKMNKLADQMITDLNKRFTKGLRDQLRKIEDTASIPDVAFQ